MTATNESSDVKTFFEMSWGEVDEALEVTDVALVTIAQVAQHGLHLPLATDVYQLRGVARCTVEKLSQRGLSVIIGPELPMGHSPAHVDFPGYVNLRPETLMNLVIDVGTSLIDQGFKRLILLNGAGGNWGSLESATYYLKRDHDDAEVYLLGWFETVMGVMGQLIDQPPGAGTDGHAGAWETSCILALAPHLVDMQKAEEYHPPIARQMSDLPFVNVNWNDQARLIGMRRIQEMSETGAWGFATSASAETGDRIMDHASTVLADHIAKYVFASKHAIAEEGEAQQQVR